MTDLATLEISGPIARLTLNRPDARNALSVDLLAALHAKVDALAAPSEAIVLIVTGAGKSFCAGMDLKAVLASEPLPEGGAGEGFLRYPSPPPREPDAFEKAKLLRRDLTGPEEHLWARLRGKQLDEYKFRRQHPLGPYIADFYCHECRLVIELDGNTHTTRDAIEYDQRRTTFLESYGIKVVRFSNDAALGDTEHVLRSIVAELKRRTNQTLPFPLPPGGVPNSPASQLLSSLAEFTIKLRHLPLLTIARVNGAAIGGGCGLACVCDFAITHADSKMGFPEVDLGVCPAVVAPWLVRRIGAARARQVLLAGGLMTGEQAFTLGMVTQAVAGINDLDAAVDALAKRLAAGGPHALRATKSLLNSLDGSDDPDIVRRGAQLSAAVLATPEARERLTASLAR